MLTGLTQEDLQTIFNCKDSCGQTLLHVACNNDAMKCLEVRPFLIAPFDVAGCLLLTPYTLCTQELLEFGADPRAVDKNGNSILHTTILTESTEAGLKILHKCKGTATMSLLNGQKKT
jgi:ankyrin repeat protein